MGVIALDFDGTCIGANDFPGIGSIKPGCVEVLRELTDSGHSIVLWTCRTENYLEEAVAFLGALGVNLNAVNQNIDLEGEWAGTDPRKIHADVYIDDKALGGFHGWDWARKELVKLGILPASPPG